MQTSGETFIPATQRPDGTWRKPRRVKDGYVPQDEVPLYESKGKQFTKSKPQYPVGWSPEYSSSNQSQKFIIPGLPVEEPKAVSKSAKKKKKKKAASAESEKTSVVNNVTDSLADARISEAAPKESEEPKKADPEKRLKNLKKKLREIETLEKKIVSGELPNPEKDQLEKMSRKDEILEEIEDLELDIGD